MSAQLWYWPQTFLCQAMDLFFWRRSKAEEAFCRELAVCFYQTGQILLD
jgi:hypothetical protein